MVYKFSDKKSAMLAIKFVAATHTGTGISSNSENQQLAKELHKLIMRKLRKHKVCSTLKNNI